MPPHVHPAATKSHTLGFQAEPLFDGGVTAQLDFASGAHHAMPRQPERTVQSPCDLPSGAGKSRGAADSAVSGDFTVRNCPNGGEDSLAHYGFVSGVLS